MKVVLPVAYARFLSGLFTNLAAAWFAAILIAPSFELTLVDIPRFLLMGLLYSWFAIKMEELI
ncbi:MAG: hypothetical protein HY381_00255 [Candidatus Chisholmbacteria bacterium]|nr:hypothetical protein [Candidatus Chisholmbacteria bacterium]